MSKINKYPRVLELINEAELTEKQDYIKWIDMKNHEAAVLIAEMHQMCKAGLSSHIPLRQRSKKSANYYYSAVGRSLHVFAKEQALTELKISSQEAQNLFSHKSFFVGGLHHETYVEIPLEDPEGN